MLNLKSCQKTINTKRILLHFVKYSGLFLLPITILFTSKIAVAANGNSIDFSSGALRDIWMIVAGILVFFMNAGFAMLEAGFCRQKNFTNVLAKNLIVFCVASLAFWMFGFSLMFSNSDSAVIGGMNGFLFHIPFSNQRETFPIYFSQLEKLWSNRSFATLFFFQLAFAGTAASIVSGSVAERIKFRAFILFSFILIGLIYPWMGHWVWGSNGFLKDPNFFNFQDFAGSTVVHSVGGIAALSGALLLGTRLEYEENNKKFFEPSDLGLCTLGCLILWLGWFGFNGGSVQYLENISHVIVTTIMSGASGGIAVLFFAILFEEKRQLGLIINGILGGLVGITASSAYVEVRWAVLIGTISGIFVLLGEYCLRLCRIDDPVGTIPVHLFCGFWGTLAVGLFCDVSGKYSPEYVYQYGWLTQTFFQLLGWLIVVCFTFILCCCAWILIGIFLYWRENKTLNLFSNEEKKKFYLGSFLSKLVKIGRKGIRVSPELEMRGSDDFFE